MSRLLLLICALMASATFADENPAPTFSPTVAAAYKTAVDDLIVALPLSLAFTITTASTVSTTGVVTLSATIEDGCTAVTGNQAAFEGTGDYAVIVACAVPAQERRLLAVSAVDLTFTPAQGPTDPATPAPTPAPTFSPTVAAAYKTAVDDLIVALPLSLAFTITTASTVSTTGVV